MSLRRDAAMACLHARFAAITVAFAPVLSLPGLAARRGCEPRFVNYLGLSVARGGASAVLRARCCACR
jgi:hypothetical protein